MKKARIDTSSKCVSLSRLIKISKKRRQQKNRMVFTNGCFDLLHVGHVSYLEKARNQGDYLVIGLNSDASVRELKGAGRPINSEQSRARVLAGLACIDYVVIFRTKRVTPLLEQLKPEIYVKGGDYTIETLDESERAAVQSYGGKIRLLPVWKGYSTTKTLQRMKKHK
jgi:rfaE bifunctional protein nucleotidyltransferase chain/domain